MSERNERGWFAKGSRPALRPETQLVRDLKRGDVAAAMRHGADGQGRRGLSGCLEFLAHEHPGAFVGLLSRMLPRHTAGSDALAAGLVRAAFKGKPSMVDMSMIETGTDAIRAALYARSRKANILASWAHDLGVPAAALEAFVTSNAKLAPEFLQRLAATLFGNATWDPATDRLMSTTRTEAKPAPVSPPAWTPAMAAAAYPPAYDPKTARAHQGSLASPATPLPTTLKPKRPGWA